MTIEKMPQQARGKLISTRQLILLWALAFSYSLAAGLLLQKIVLPMMPDMHGGLGLMRGDAVYFHETAVMIAERINLLGWKEWKLVPGGALTGNVGLLSALYALLGPNPAWLLPLNAAFHALGGLLIVLIGIKLLPTQGGLRASLAAGFLFLVFPSALIWFGQNHKDTFAIAGFLLALFAFIRAVEGVGAHSFLANGLYFAIGLALVASMRPHLVLVYLVAFGAAFACLTGYCLLRWRLPRAKIGILPALALLVVGLAVLQLAPANSHIVEHGVAVDGVAVDGVAEWRWLESSAVPTALDELARKVSSIRTHFINYGLSEGAGSIIDGHIKPESAGQVAAYLPRALVVGLFAPFPNFWMEKLSLPRIIGALETLVFYLLFPGILFLLRYRTSKPLLICLAVAGAALIVNSFVSPNIGTLHRIRYGQWFVFLLMGACGWALLSRTLMSRFGAPGSGASSESQAVVGPAAPNAYRTAGAGVLVLLVSLAGFIGLLVRDLLLIDRVGFGTALDSYYLAIMLPTFFTGLLSLPLGDALSARISQLADRLHIQQLLAGTTSVTLLLFALVSAALLLFSGSISHAFSNEGDVNLTMQLLPVALLLLIFSGAIIAGNSVINALGRPVLAASAQLLVPLVVVAFILMADEGEIVSAAMAGMAAGQFANLLLLALVLKRFGFKLVPGTVRPLRAEKDMLNNFKWLVLCALLTGAALPVNYWFAGQIGIGALSTWALGSKLVQISSLFGAALMTAVFVPYMSKLVALGLKARIRDDLFMPLILGSWGCAIIIAAVFVFAEPIIHTASNGLDNPQAAHQLVGILKFGTIQLPFVLSALLLFKLCAVSAVSTKAAIAAFIGLLANLALNILLAPSMGLVGLALAWTISSLVATLVAFGVTRTQSHLSTTDILILLANWAVLIGLAAAIHFQSLTSGGVVLLAAAILMKLQLRVLSMQRGETAIP